MCRPYTSHSTLVGRPFCKGPLAGVTVPTEALTAFVLDFVQEQLSRMLAMDSLGGWQQCLSSEHRAGLLTAQ